MSTQIMKAVQYEKGGSPDKMSLAEVARPTLKEGELLLKIHSSAVNRADTLQVGNFCCDLIIQCI